jgi:hypothetical protein
VGFCDFIIQELEDGEGDVEWLLWENLPVLIDGVLWWMLHPSDVRTF